MLFKENDVVVCVNNAGFEDVLEIGQEYEVAILVYEEILHVAKANDVFVIEYPFAAHRFLHKKR